MVVGALLFCTSGYARMALINATLLWLVTDRLMGGRALYDPPPRETKEPDVSPSVWGGQLNDHKLNGSGVRSVKNFLTNFGTCQ